MLEFFIFGSLAGVLGATQALSQSMSFAGAFGIYLAISLFSIVVLPLGTRLCLRLERTILRVRGAVGASVRNLMVASLPEQRLLGAQTLKRLRRYL